MQWVPKLVKLLGTFAREGKDQNAGNLEMVVFEKTCKLLREKPFHAAEGNI